jgi:hypothetical protein
MKAIDQATSARLKLAPAGLRTCQQSTSRTTVTVVAQDILDLSTGSPNEGTSRL